MDDMPSVPDLHPDRLRLADGTEIPLSDEHRDPILAYVREAKARALIDATTLTTAALRTMARNMRQKWDAEPLADEDPFVRVCMEKWREAKISTLHDAAEAVESVIGAMVYDVRHQVEREQMTREKTQKSAAEELVEFRLASEDLFLAISKAFYIDRACGMLETYIGKVRAKIRGPDRKAP